MLSDPQLHYLDNAATSRVDPAVAQAVSEALTELWANPSSLYDPAVAAQDAIAAARARVAKTLHCRSDEIYFTACGSEGNNMAVTGAARPRKHWGNKIVVTGFEHPSVQRPIRALKDEGFTVVEVMPGADGRIDMQKFLAEIDKNTVLAACMAVNNETGAVNDIAAVARMLKAENSIALLHTDAVQGFLKVPFSAKTLGADMITISGHKIHAPKGIGALYIRSGLKLPPYILGGGQERGMRAGTEATPQIAAFGTAAEIGSAKMAQATKTMAELRAHAIDRLTAEVDGLVVIGGGSPHILSISLPGYRSEVLMNFLEARGIYTSKSSACKKGGRSHVLEAIGLPANVIDGALRISFSRYTTREDIDALCDALRDAKQSLFPSLH